jgi:hypothetical protein
VGHAAAFNHLTHYPDNATVKFDFDFGIKAIVAIAPVDGQYQPTDRLVPVENVNYLVFHGSHDGDVSSFMGIRQYQRVAFTDGEPHFKAAVFVYRANHGQWNTVWGAHDNGPRSARNLDLRTLMDPEDQRKFAKLYISAFLDASLKGDKRYLPMFRDYRVAGGWLPKTMYTTRFEESTFRPVATFEEDIDVTTGTENGVKLEGDSVATWKESRLTLRTANSPAEGSSQYNNAVTIGWNNRIAGDDTTKVGRPAAYTITLPTSLPREWSLDDRASLQFLMMPTEAMPGARAPKPDSTKKDSTAAKKPAKKPAPKKKDDDEKKPPVDLSIELIDAAGVSAKLPLSSYGVIRRPLDAYILRRRGVEKSRFASLSELVLQTYSLPLDDFKRAVPQLDLSSLRQVRFLFDRSIAGTIVVDEIGFSHMDPAFRRVVVADR